MKNIPILLLSIFLLTFMSCREDSIINNTDLIIPEPTIIVESSVSGFVVSNDDNPVIGANVSIDNQETTTDENGYFLIRDVRTDAQHTVINVNKDGFFEATDVIGVQEGDIARTKIVLAEKVLVSKITSTNKIVKDRDLIEIDFNNTEFVDQAGVKYSGNVNAFTTYIDPTVENISEIMPGNLSAIDNANQITGLESYGMVGVILEDENGNELQPNTPVEIQIAVPESLLNSAPNTIPLWHFDETTGYWIEEGVAVLDGNKYVGEVSHFSFWNCDIPEDFIYLEGFVFYEDQPLSGMEVRLTRKSNGDSRSSLTSNSGHFGGKVPTDEKYLLEIFDGCNERVHWEDNIGPYNTDRHKGTIKVESSESFYSISGLLTNCNNEPVLNGYVSLSNGDGYSTISISDNGEFSGAVSSCTSSIFSINGHDLDNREQGTSREIDLATSSSTNLKACGEEIIEGVSFKLNGQDYFYDFCKLRIEEVLNDSLGVLGLSLTIAEDANSTSVKYTYIYWNPSEPIENALKGYSQEITEKNGPPNLVLDIDIEVLDFTPEVEIGEYWIFNIPGTVLSWDSGIVGETTINISALRVQ